MLCRPAACGKQIDQRHNRQQRFFFQGQPQIAMVSCGVRHDWGVSIGRQFRFCSRHGHAFRHDIHVDMTRLHPGLFCRGVYPAPCILPTESHHHIHLSETAARPQFIQDGRRLLHALRHDGCCRQVLCGVHHPAASGARCLRGALLHHRAAAHGHRVALHP